MTRIEVANRLAKLNTTFQYLKISHFIEVISEVDMMEVDKASLKQLGEFYLNYHSLMARFPEFTGWTYCQFYVNDNSFRALTEHQKKFILEEDKRINNLFGACIGDSQKLVYLFMYFANYSIALLDGFRVSYWLYRALELSKTHSNLSDETKFIHGRLKELVLSTLDIAPYKKDGQGSSRSNIYIDFDAVTKYLISLYGISIDEECQHYTLRLSAFFSIS